MLQGIGRFDEEPTCEYHLDDRQLIKAYSISVGRLVVQACPEEFSSEGTRACKSKVQSGALLRVVSVIVPFCLEVRGSKKKGKIKFIWPSHN